MEEKIILPQNTRLMGALLGFIGGGLDVFCHMHYRSLVATQTGNLLLLIADWHDPRVENTIMRFSSILFFSIGFVVALHIREYRKTAFWRTKMLIPLFVVTLLIPLVSVIPPVEVPFIAFGTGMMMLTFTGSLIEKSPLCDLYDFWKLPQDADGLVPNHSRKGRFGRVSQTSDELRDCRWKLCCRSY